MPSAGEMMSMRGMGMPRTRRGGGTRRVMMQRPVTPMLPPAAPSDKGGALVANKSPRLRPLSERMASAYDKLYKDGKPPETDPLTQAALGKLVLEIQQTNASIAGIQQGLTLQSRQKKNVSNEEKKLLKKEEDNLVNVRGAFLDIRAKFGLFAGALAIKSLMEGRPGDAAVNAGAAVASFLPEIINIVTGAVVGKTLLGGKKGGVPAPRGRMAMPRGGGKLGLGLGLLGLAGVGVGMAQGNNADARRQELIKQDRSNPITSVDTKRFSELSNRFDAILTRMEANQSPKRKAPGPKAKEEDDAPRRRGGPDRSYSVSPDGSTTSSTQQRASSFVPEGYKGTLAEQALLQTIGQLEGADYNTVYGGAKVPQLTQMTLGELYSAIKLGGDDAIPERLGGGTIPFKKDDKNSSASGFLQLMPQTLKGLLDRGDFKESDIFTPDLQNRIAITLTRQGGIDPNDGLDMGEMSKLNNLWASFGPRYGQSQRTLAESEAVFLENLERLENQSVKIGDTVGEFPVEPTPEATKTSPIEPFEKSSLNFQTKPGNFTIVPLPTGGEQPKENPVLLASTSPVSQSPNINPDFDDITSLIQELSYLTEFNT